MKTDTRQRRRKISPVLRRRGGGGGGGGAPLPKGTQPPPPPPWVPSVRGVPPFQAHAGVKPLTCGASARPPLRSILRNPPVWCPESPALGHGPLLRGEELTVSSPVVIPSDPLWKCDGGPPEQCTASAWRGSDGGQVPGKGRGRSRPTIRSPSHHVPHAGAFPACAPGRRDAGQSVTCPSTVVSESSQAPSQECAHGPRPGRSWPCRLGSRGVDSSSALATGLPALCDCPQAHRLLGGPGVFSLDRWCSLCV